MSYISARKAALYHNLVKGDDMNIFVILISLVIALVIIIPLLEKYQSKMGLESATKYSKYIWPLVMISLVVQLIYVLVN